MKKGYKITIGIVTLSIITILIVLSSVILAQYHEGKEYREKLERDIYVYTLDCKYGSRCSKLNCALSEYIGSLNNFEMLNLKKYTKYKITNYDIIEHLFYDLDTAKVDLDTIRGIEDICGLRL